MTDSSHDKYIDQRFKNVEEKLDHRVEMVSIKIDALSDKISDNTEWMKQMVSDNADSMKQMVNTISADVKEIKSEGKTTRITIAAIVAGALFTLFVGFGGILYMINQMQNSWLQKYLDITNKPNISQPINSLTNTQSPTPAKSIKPQQTKVSSP